MSKASRYKWNGTVSGNLDHFSNPLELYKKSGFIGDDIWGICSDVSAGWTFEIPVYEEELKWKRSLFTVLTQTAFWVL